ncbi:hypothetical protein [Azospirillum endophyticum]
MNVRYSAALTIAQAKALPCVSAFGGGRSSGRAGSAGKIDTDLTD